LNYRNARREYWGGGRICLYFLLNYRNARREYWDGERSGPERATLHGLTVYQIPAIFS